MATSQFNLDSLNAGRRSNSEADMATAQRKPAGLATSQLSPCKFLRKNVVISQLQPWQGLSCGVAMFPFEILCLPRFVHRKTCRVVPQLAALHAHQRVILA